MYPSADQKKEVAKFKALSLICWEFGNQYNMSVQHNTLLRATPLSIPPTDLETLVLC